VAPRRIPEVRIDLQLAVEQSVREYRLAGNPLF
jgi:hypothetical protein